MILGSTVVLYRLLSIAMSAGAKAIFAVSLVLLVVIEGYFHMVKDEYVLHELLFAAMLLVICGRTTILLRRVGTAQKLRERDMRMAVAGAGLYNQNFVALLLLLVDADQTPTLGAIVFGYFLWQLDHRICNQLNSARHSLGMPWGFLLEVSSVVFLSGSG